MKKHIFVISTVIFLIISLHFFIVQPSNYRFVTEKYFYLNGGYGGYNSSMIWVSFPNATNGGQWTYLTKPFLYGDYVWEGRYISNATDGWAIQGFTDGNACKYIAFERIYTDDIFRCITYDKFYTSQQWWSPDTSTYLNFTNFSDWNKYEIRWRPTYASFYINDNLVANHTTNVPKIPLFFHTHACVASWMDYPNDKITSKVYFNFSSG